MVTVVKNDDLIRKRQDSLSAKRKMNGDRFMLITD